MSNESLCCRIFDMKKRFEIDVYERRRVSVKWIIARSKCQRALFKTAVLMKEFTVHSTWKNDQGYGKSIYLSRTRPCLYSLNTTFFLKLNYWNIVFFVCFCLLVFRNMFFLSVCLDFVIHDSRTENSWKLTD